MQELFLVLAGGFAGGVIRGVTGVIKSWRNGKRIRKRYFCATIVGSALIGLVAGLFAESDVKFAILAGFVGTDFIESLYKVRYREKYKPSNRKIKIP